VDGDEAGGKIALKLRERYASWDAGRFGQFAEAQFELYYPAVFSSRVDEVLAIGDKRDKREAKRKLLNDVLAWLNADSQRAREALEASAHEVIEFLRQIEKEMTTA
jgi:dihydroxyacetone kinase